MGDTSWFRPTLPTRRSYSVFPEGQDPRLGTCPTSSGSHSVMSAYAILFDDTRLDQQDGERYTESRDRIDRELEARGSRVSR